jgi:2,4-dienoyl-CoA reductase-like NADH-dependent reductase (Old Yellow Enzyme family)
MSHLFTPYTLGSLALTNRIVIAPMCQYSADDGRASDWHPAHLGTLALSGAGLLIIEATAVEAVGRITPGCLGLYSDGCEQALAGVLTSVRRHSPMPIGIQLAHAGRKGSSEVPWRGGGLIALRDGGWVPVAPSALPHGEAEAPPLALDAAGLKRVKQAFVDAALRALRLQLDLVELHSAHGYLLHQFLSPIANQRTDAYGGSLQARLRFPLEVFDAMRAVLPASMPLGVRLSAIDWVDGGWDLEQSIAYGRALRERGCTYLHVSSGGVSPKQQIVAGPGYQLPFAERLKQEVGLPTIAVGLITEPEQAEAVIAGGQADLVALARAMLFNPRWPWHAAAQLGAQVHAVPQYWRCQPRGHGKLFGDVRTGQR